MAQGKKQIVVVLDTRNDKKNSVKYNTDGANDDQPDNIYIPNKGVEKLGSPDKVKVTIEAA